MVIYFQTVTKLYSYSLFILNFADFTEFCRCKCLPDRRSMQNLRPHRCYNGRFVMSVYYIVLKDIHTNEYMTKFLYNK